jgi:tetratricopeptide (TPR) repeat protein
MHGDTKLEPNDSAYNDYIIDLVVAKSWRQKGFYENAMAKYQQALRDLRQATFPDEAENKIALAGVYEMLADLSQTQRQYVDSVVYAKAAIALGDVLWGQHYVCYGHYMLKEYDAALPPCTDTIRLTGNLKALFWRGKAYEALGRRDEAERDFTDVAGSEGEFRSSAAIALSILYFNRRDNQAALDVLNRYSYLYEENITRKSDIAVAYNNRCYAYMQLGDLRKALDDCTASLHYGSLPDAFRKQQELVSRLKAPGEGARPAEN